MTRWFAALALGLGCLLVPTSRAVRATPLLPALFGPAAPQPSLVFTYDGWRVDAAHTARAQRPMKTVKAIEVQIDLIERLSLPKSVLVIMRGTPVIALPGGADDPDGYVRGHGVLLPIRGLNEKRPTLLRLMLYAYADQGLPRGSGNPDAERFRQEAVGKHVWPITAAMLRSGPDYFAMVASAYLTGAITREPYTRADLCKTQPDACQWLAQLFDGGRARPTSAQS